MPFPEIHNILGTFGVLAILVAYIALQAEALKFDDYTFLVLNGLGSFLIVLSLMVDFNFSAFFIESAWVCISLYGFFKRWTKDKKRE